MNFEGYRPSNSQESEEKEEIKKDNNVDEDIPVQYRGLNSETLDFIWTIPEYVDQNITEKLKSQKARALSRLRELEVEENNNNKTDSEQKLFGWTASYKLAKIAKLKNIDLSTLSREDYVNFAIDNNLMIDDTQLRMSPWQRMCESPDEVILGNRDRNALIEPSTDEAFDKFSFEIIEKAKGEDRSLDTNIRVRQGTKDSNSWLFFGINKGIVEDSSTSETFKSYISLKDLNQLTPEIFTTFMQRLRNAGYNGDIKIFQDLTSQGINLNDQIVMHGASEADAILGLRVSEYFFGENLDQESIGKDLIIDGKQYSYSELLANKIKEAVQKK